MFTGIVKGLCPVGQVVSLPGQLSYCVEMKSEWMDNLQIGASVSIDGVCQTVVKIHGNEVWFDAIQETLNRTTLVDLKKGRLVNVERSARFSDEIGGHILSGHIFGRAEMIQIQQKDGQYEVTFQCLPVWSKYLFSKGYIGIDGMSLTLVDVDLSGKFSVHLIPETLRVTTLGFKKPGDFVNLEFDSKIQAIVETVERVLAQSASSKS